MLQLENITKSFRDGDNELSVLRGVYLTLADGEQASIMGSSGCGKSTLLHILGGIERADSGSYTLDGESLDRMSPAELAEIRARKIGMVFQSFFLVKSLDCIENVGLPLGYAGVAAKERRERALEALDAVGMADMAKKQVTKLSGGQMQRVAIARAIVSRPKLLICDEPTGSLDSSTAERIIELICGLSRKNGSTLIIVTHDKNIADVCERRFVMSDGILSDAEL